MPQLSHSPYPGLRPFTRYEADIFFGREAQVDQLLEKLRRSRFLAVVGASGCGKSSLIRAGLIPSLETGFMVNAGARWRVAEMRPGDHPLARLAQALLEPPQALAEVQGSGPEALAWLKAELRRGPRGLIEVMRRTPLPRGANLLLLVDQFEEIFRFREEVDPNEADAFVALLLATVESLDVPAYVVIAMRSDFLGDCALFRGLPEAINDNQYLTPRLIREQLRAAIVGPARVFGGKVESSLINQLLNEIGPDPDQLPLLQHALMRMWLRVEERLPATEQRADAATLTLEDYAAVGRLAEALSNHADEVLHHLTGEQQRIAEVLFRRLTERSIGKRDIRRPARLQDVAEVAGVSCEAIAAVVEELRETGRHFITPPPPVPLATDTLLDIGHESLIRQWKTLNAWVDQEARSAAIYQRLKQTAHLWKAGDAAPWGGVDLERILAWQEQERPTLAWAKRYGSAEDFTLAEAFLRVSQEKKTQEHAQEQANRAFMERLESRARVAEIQGLKAETTAAQTRARLQRRVARLALLSLLLAGVLAGIAGYQWQQTERERSLIDEHRWRDFSRKLVLQAKDQLNRRFDRALLLTAEATRVRPTLEARNSLLSGLLHRPQLNYFLHGHTAEVQGVAFSPAGKLLASGSADNTILLWDLTSRTPLGAPLTGHKDEVWSVAFSPDGKLLASGGGDKTIILWDLASRTPLGAPLTGHNDLVSSVAFSPDGKRLASGSWDNTIILWDVASRTPLGAPLTGHKDMVSSVAFSPDGKRLASGSWDNTILLWDVASRTPLGAPLTGHRSGISTIAFSPDKRTLASGSLDQTVRLWDVASRTPLGEALAAHKEGILEVAFSPDGKLLASAGMDKTIILWDIANQRPLGEALKGHRLEVSSVAFSPDGKRLASGGWDNTIILWDVAHRRSLGKPLIDYHDEIWSVAFSPEGKFLAFGSKDKTVHLWDRLRRTLIDKPLTGHTEGVSSVAFSPDGTLVASGSEDNTVRLWDVASQEPFGKPLGHNGAVWSVAFSPDGTLVASGSEDNTVRLWDVASREPLGKPFTGEDEIWNVAFSPGGKLLASGGAEGTLRLWDVASRALLGEPLASHDKIWNIAFSPGGKLLASGGAEGALYLWDVASRRLLGGEPLQGHKGDVLSIAFSPDGRYLASSSEDKRIILWAIGIDAWLQRACTIANRNLTCPEWQEYLGNKPYRKTCPSLPGPKTCPSPLQRTP